MGDNKLTQVPGLINQGTFQVRHGGGIGDTVSLLDMQCINVSERVKSYQSSLNSHLHSFGKTGSNNIDIISIGSGGKEGGKVSKCSTATTDVAENLLELANNNTSNSNSKRWRRW